MPESLASTITGQLLVHLKPLEARRRSMLRMNRWIHAAGGTLALAVFGALVTIGVSSQVAIVVGTAILIATLLAAYGRQTPLKDEAKRLYLQAVAEAMGLEYSEPPQWTDIDGFREHHLLGSWDRTIFRDGLAGQQENMAFRLVHAHLEDTRASGVIDNEYATHFQGVLIEVDLPRAHATDILILRDEGWFNGLSKPARGNWQRVGLGDTTFENAFEVFARDQVEARVFLSPPVMEQLLHLEEVWHGRKLRAALVGPRMQIAVEAGGLMRFSSLDQSFLDPVRAGDFVREVLAVRELVALTAGSLARLQGPAPTSDAASNPSPGR